MPLNNFMTATATTTRNAAMVGGKRGDPVTHLENVKITTVMLPDINRVQTVRKAIGLDGTAVQIFEIYSESHSHTDDSVLVTQVPDIKEGDRVITGGITYNVRAAEVNPATTSFGATLLMTVTEDRRA
jgi:hypothetical protein